MTQSTADMLYDEVRATARTLDEIWEAIDGERECPDCAPHDDSDCECETCDQTGTVSTYEGQDAREYLEEMPLEIVWEKGEPFAVVLGTGGPHTEITGGGSHSGTDYVIEGYWSGEHVTWRSEGVTKTGEYYREMMEQSE